MMSDCAAGAAAVACSGAGSVGGRMRAREVKRLFGAVADRLDGWAEDIEECDRLFYSGDVRVS